MTKFPKSLSLFQFEDMNPRRAIEVMNRHNLCKPEKALSMEITSALTDSIISTATAPTDSPTQPIQISNSKNKVGCCNTGKNVKLLKSNRKRFQK